MPTLIREFADGTSLIFDDGKFDGWCVYETFPDRPRRSPRDVDYFGTLLTLAMRHGAETIYRDFCRVYEQTTNNLENKQRVFQLIQEISAHYHDDGTAINRVLTILYAAMIAEENKAGTKLGKRIKRLGVYQVLMERIPPLEAAQYSKQMRWRQIDEICRRYGF